MIKKLLLITLIAAGSMQAASSSTTTTAATPVATTTTTAATAIASLAVRSRPGRFRSEHANLLEESAHRYASATLADALSRPGIISFDHLSAAMPLLPDELTEMIINRIMVLIVVSRINMRPKLRALNTAVTAYAKTFEEITSRQKDYKKILEQIDSFIGNYDLSYAPNALNNCHLIDAINDCNNDMFKYIALLGLDSLNTAEYINCIKHAIHKGQDLKALQLIEDIEKHHDIKLSTIISDIFAAAASKCNIPLMKGLMNRNGPDNKSFLKMYDSNTNNTMLNHALQARDETFKQRTDAALWLIEQGTNIENGQPLLWAARIGSIPVMKALVAKSINVNNTNPDSNTSALHTALSNGKEEAASWLIDNGAEVDRPDNEGLTPLLFAIDKNYPAIAQKILAKKPELERRYPPHNHTALTYSFALARLEIAQLLLNNGAGTEATTNLGNNILLLLVSNCADIFQANVTQEEYRACLALALQHTNINHKNNIGNTALHLAYTTQQGRELVVPILLARGASTTIVNNRGLTPEQMPLRAQL